MRAIYGERGVKAGYTDGQCRADLLRALDDIVAKGAEVVILGCTELPLVLSQPSIVTSAGNTVALIDPTDVLARKTVELSAQGVKLPA